MTATITKIGPVRPGAGGKGFQIICFRLEGGGSAITYISPVMRNYKDWQHLRVGMVLDKLKFRKDGKTIDADSKPEIVRPLEEQGELL